MGRIKIFIILMFLAITTVVPAYAEVNIAPERTTVVNSLPEVTIYMDTDKNMNANMNNTEVLVDDEITDIQSVGAFKKLDEGITYYILIDLSKSVSAMDFETIKKGIINFSRGLSKKDKVYLVPFGETVYMHDTAYDPTDAELEQEVNKLELDDDYTQLYNAIDTVRDNVENEKGTSLPSRNIAMIFTDGADDTTGGYISAEEVAANMKSAGIPLYGFVVGNDAAGKDRLGMLCRDLNGSITDINEENIDTELAGLKKVLDNTLTIKTNVRTSESIGLEFAVRILVDGEQLLVKENIKANKGENSKDVFAVAFRKLVTQYWWVILVISLSVVAFVILMVIRRNKGIVNIEGKVVYGSKIQRKYHVQVKEHNLKQLHLNISFNGQESVSQDVIILESIIVGRSNICDVYFDDVNMSRQHFSIEIENDELYLNDLDSTSGTYINGLKVYTKQRLNKGDLIIAGKTHIKINW